MKHSGFREEELEEAQDLPADSSRLIIQLSHATVRTVIDAAVELVTNSDDSYKRLEKHGIPVSGRIVVKVRRLKYGKCELLEVLDFGQGMSRDKLREALMFAGRTSGFEEGESVRGFFGRGMKEAILALGTGEIRTLRDGKLSSALLWSEGNKPKCRLPKLSRKPTYEEREDMGILEGDGTLVRITVSNEKIKCPDFKTFEPQLSKHYALRDINSSSKRKVILQFESPEKTKTKHSCEIAYQEPQGKEIADQSVTLPQYGDVIRVRIFESEEELESPYNDPFARAGLLIKTSGAILDNQLFRYQGERAGRYFFGEVVWEGLAERLRRAESLVDMNRCGIEWQHDVCALVGKEVEGILGTHIERKKRQLGEKPTAPPSERVRNLNRAICSLLNRLAKQHLLETLIDVEPDPEIDELTIKPSYANIQVDKDRPFSVYAPLSILDIGAAPYKVEVESSNPDYIQILNPTLELHPHRKYPSLYYGNFRLIGRIDGEEALVTCRLGDQRGTANVRVAPPGKMGPRKKPGGTKKGFFRDIRPNLEKSPDQRVSYDHNLGVISIYVRFPGLGDYFEDNLGFRRDDSKLVYAELIGEAFCRFVARHDVESGKVPIVGTGSDAAIDAFVTATNNAQKKFMHLIHQAIGKRGS